MTKHTSPFVDLDFYIPVKDGEKYIAACLESVCSQTLKPKRIVVYLHTPCLDKTEEIAKQFPVEIHRVDVPLSDVRNIALKEMDAKWIGCCDADVVLAPDWIEKLWSKTSGNYSLISGNTQERIQTLGDWCRSILSPHNWGEYDVDNPYIFAPDMLALRQRLADLTGYRSGLFNYEDSDLCKRLKEKGDQIYYLSSARAMHIREDDLHSWFNQRWAHSFPRQEYLYETPEGLYQKLLNNFSLTTTLFGKALEFDKVDALPSIILMPLHHFVKDLNVLCKSKKNAPSNKEASELERSLQNCLELISPQEAKLYWEQIKIFNGNTLSQNFLKYYAFFISKCLQQSTDLKKRLGNKNELLFRLQSSESLQKEAISDKEWNEYRKTLHFKIQKFFGKDLKRVLFRNTNPSLLDEEGILEHRQKIFPDSDKIFTCKDVTEYVASFGMKLLWTETFQGSTMIAYTKGGIL
ncbi:MAG: glycosyltransferase family 2 protein [Deltaproteobacteria bacterium]|nr:glycosyltransferase family 2 protein [Deltaproteobacteria bacterium]